MDRSKPLHLYWFSGTGNSLLIANVVREFFVNAGFQVGLSSMEKADMAKPDHDPQLGFIVPVAGQGTYPLVWEFFESLPDADGTVCFLIDTLGIYSGGILGPVKKILRKKGYRTLAATEIRMPNNFQKSGFRPVQDGKLIQKGINKANAFCVRLLSGRGLWIDIPVYSALMSMAYRRRELVQKWAKLFPLVFDEDKCTRCGLCVRICPENALCMDAGGGVPWKNEKCILCHRCFAFCPAEAISIGSKKAVRYKAVSLKDFLAALNNKAG